MSDIRISKTSKPLAPTKKITKNQGASAESFTTFLKEKQHEKTKKELDEMMSEISEKGKSLTDSKNLELLVSYKKMVKNFLEKATKHAFEIIDSKGIGRVGRTKILKIISAVDENLIALTDEFISSERSKIKLLDKIGELEGLLTDIYI